MFLPRLLAALAALAHVQALPASGPSDAPGSCQMLQKPTPNPNLRCGWPGPLDPVRVRTLGTAGTAADLETCAEVCYMNAKCVSFGYSRNQTCQLYSRSLLLMNTAPTDDATDSSTTFYNRGCWRQDCAVVAKPCVCTAEFTETALVFRGTRISTSTVFATKTLAQQTKSAVTRTTDISSQCKNWFYKCDPILIKTIVAVTPVATSLTTLSSTLEPSTIIQTSFTTLLARAYSAY